MIRQAKHGKRSTVYLDPDLLRILKIRAAESDRSVSYLINEAVLHELAEDADDIKAFEARKKEAAISYAQLLKELKKDGKI